MKDLTGKTAFITGGAQGIGLGIARALAREGTRLALVDVDADALRAAHAELSELTDVETVELDVRDRARYTAAADQVEQRLGPVSLLFNNAGVAGGVAAAEMTYEMWDWVLGVNVNGVVNGIQTFVPRMIDRGGDAHIVNTASGAGLVGFGSGFLYATSKFAVVGMSEALRMELPRHGIGVSVLCPGPVATGIIDNTANLRPDGEAQPSSESAIAKSKRFLEHGTPADVVGEMVLAAIRADQLYIHTDGLSEEPIKRRTKALLDAIPRT
jgi:NAD(P)-dependent dehydrogenase (short-subunit alcohol dehydrogenase family)